MTVIIADDHPIYTEGLSNLLKSYGHDVLACAENGEEAVELALKMKPDVVLMDVNMPVMNGVEAAKIITAGDPEIKVLVLTGLDDQDVLLKAVRAGASGFLLKNLNGDELEQRLRELESGNKIFSPESVNSIVDEFRRISGKEQKTTAFSPRQLEILEKLSIGLTYKEIGDKLFLSERTIKYHIKRIKDNCGLNSQAQLIEFYKSQFK